MHRVSSLVVGSILLFPVLVPAQFLPPGLPFGDNAGEDVMVDHLFQGSSIHMVWASNVDYTGSAGTDPDIFYAHFDGSSWSSPVLVNSYGASDNASTDDEQSPRLAQGPDGALHCVWQSRNPLQGASDWDVLYASSTGSTWSTAEVLADHSADVVLPTVITRENGDPLVVWQTPWSLLGYRVRVAGTWSAEISLPSSGTGLDRGPVALARSDDGTLVAAWSTTRHSGGTDADIVFSQLPPTGSWSSPMPVSDHAYGDPGNDLNPAVAVLGSGATREIHVVWETTSSIVGGPDGDLLGAVIPAAAFVPSLNPTYLVNRNGSGDSHADQLPSLCVEPGGVVHVAWQTRDANNHTDLDVLHAYNPTPGGLWSDPDLLGLNGFFDSPGEDDSRPDLECGGRGLLSGAWQSTDDLLGTVSGGDHEVFHALGLGSDVSRPEPINPGSDFDSKAQAMVDLVVDNNGVLHAAYAREKPGGGLEVVYTRNEGLGWTAPELVSDFGPATSGATNRFPRMEVGEQGQVHVVWESEFNLGGVAGIDMDVFYSMRDQNGWSPAELVNSSAIGPNVSHRVRELRLASNGTPHVLWVEDLFPSGERLMWSRKAGAGWAAEEQVANASGQGITWGASLWLDPQGTPHVCWSSYLDYLGSGHDADVLYSSRTNGSWGPPEYVNDLYQTDGARDSGCRLVGTSEGELWAVVTSNLDRDGAGGGDADLFVSRRLTSGWQPLTLLLESARSDDHYEADVQAEAVGDSLVVAWLIIVPSGTDSDIGYAVVDLASLPSPAPWRWANATAVVEADSFDWDYLDALSISRNGRAHFAWSSTLDRLGNGHTDQDVYHAWVTLPIAPFFADGFESGDTVKWSSSVP